MMIATTMTKKMRTADYVKAMRLMGDLVSNHQAVACP